MKCAWSDWNNKNIANYANTADTADIASVNHRSHLIGNRSYTNVTVPSRVSDSRSWRCVSCLHSTACDTIQHSRKHTDKRGDANSNLSFLIVCSDQLWHSDLVFGFDLLIFKIIVAKCLKAQFRHIIRYSVYQIFSSVCQSPQKKIFF